jgi:serine/threonine-protein kinase
MSEEKLLNDRYLLKGTLGRGGMAMVYLAEDRMLEREVAVKVLKAEFARDPAFRERFRQEAKAAANLSHPNIVPVYDFGFHEKRLYIVMEYIPGRDLYTIIQEKGRLSTELGLDLSIKACKGIGYAHRAGLVHCDVKPHNLLVTPDMQLKVTDFGIARALASIDPGESSKVVWGSPQYFSPEQASGEPPSPASDVYSVGVVMYQMFTGQLPFIGKTSRELARMHRMAQPIPPSELNPFLPPQLDEVILKVLDKEPSARYRTADQLGRVLQMVYERQKSTTAESVQPFPREPVSVTPSEVQPYQTGDTYLYPEAAPAPSAIDWVAVVLGMLAVTAWGGLIPFLIWVFNRVQ